MTRDLQKSTVSFGDNRVSEFVPKQKEDYTTPLTYESVKDYSKLKASHVEIGENPSKEDVSLRRISTAASQFKVTVSIALPVTNKYVC